MPPSLFCLLSPSRLLLLPLFHPSHHPLSHFPIRHLPSPTLMYHPCVLLPPLFAGDGDDNRPGMRGGHQMVIDVQTGKTHAASVMTWLFNQRYDSYPPTHAQNAKLYYCLIELTLPPTPALLQNKTVLRAFPFLEQINHDFCFLKDAQLVFVCGAVFDRGASEKQKPALCVCV